MSLMLELAIAGLVLQAAPATPPAAPPPPHSAVWSAPMAFATSGVHVRMGSIRMPHIHAGPISHGNRRTLDSSSVAGLLTSLAASPPAVCELAVDMLGNGWGWSGGGGGVNALRDEPSEVAVDRAALQSGGVERRAMDSARRATLLERTQFSSRCRPPGCQSLSRDNPTACAVG